MKYLRLLIILGFVVTTAPEFVIARENVGTSSGKGNSHPPTVNAACSEPTAQSDLAVNNVRCRILMADLWRDPNGAAYEVPKGSGLNSIFAGSLWIGGVDVGGQLKVAAQTYRQTGNDFWPGPLDTTNASVSFDVCSAYDKHFRITRKEVEAFVSSGEITPAIANWPGNGDVSLGQARFLAPFFDKNQDGKYNPKDGDYPGYDLVEGDGYGECQKMPKPYQCIPVDQLFGDETIWWVFNDKGNIHTETKGQPIGLEIRAQAFGFFTDDEINNMTFYNYRIFNRSTFQIDSCYFGIWCDSDLGYADDDYVGCDVARGLGYTYNADDDDNPPDGYGANPPAVGIDFFRGPIADAGDGKDNDRNCKIDEACEEIIMSGFLYFDNKNNVPYGNPTGAAHYYNYLKMKWGDGTPVIYNGKTGYGGTGPKCNFMYPGNPSTDLHDWGTIGTCSTTPTLPAWDEVTAGNAPLDRRMLQSAGPFTLLPGAVNVITSGVVWARALSGGAQASVKLMKAADDKAQALFNNCFKVLDGPNAPDLAIQELDKELILYLTNKPSSNNFNENYAEVDPLIILQDSLGNPCPNVDRTYRFEGYKIYQLKSATVSANDLEDPNSARLIFQCDVKNGVSRILNYEADQTLGAIVPREKVNGANAGLQHSLRVTKDAFTSGGPLVNHKTYYFMAVAYGYNQYKKYAQDVPPGPKDACNPNIAGLNGQKKAYKQGRKNLVNYSAIPHISTPYTGGTEMHGQYGSGPKITRVEGNGNGGRELEFDPSTVSSILSSTNGRAKNPTYDYGKGPINVRVVDPLNVPDGETFVLKFDSTNITNSTWTLVDKNTSEIVKSDKTIKVLNEQLLMKWGLAISIVQIGEIGTISAVNNGFISANMTFADPTKKWLTGLADKDGASYSNWIRAGKVKATGGFEDDYLQVDSNQVYEGVIGGTWAPYALCAATDISGFSNKKYYTGPGFKNLVSQAQVKDLASVEVVLTSDKSKWTRSVVLELCEDSTLSANTAGFPTKARKFDFRRAASVDKNGSTATGSDNNDFPTGMGWFPGYAINLETGERLNIAFGENSALTKENGNDMKWNPTSNQTASNYHLPWDSAGQAYGSPVFGGQHYIYVFGHNKDDDSTNSPAPNDFINVPRYDAGKKIRQVLGLRNGLPNETAGGKEKSEIFRDAMWVNIPLLAASHSLLETDVTIHINVGRSYKYGYSPVYIQDGNKTIYVDTASAGVQNRNLPMYSFSTEGIATHTKENDIAFDALDQIRVVPNPYYAYSNYEKNQLDNRVKITNLPEICTVSIYNLSGTLINRFKKGAPLINHPAQEAATTIIANDAVVTTWDGSLDWDLKNLAGIPISSGVYIIHVEVPGVGEKIVKWFGIMRPIDLDSF